MTTTETVSLADQLDITVGSWVAIYPKHLQGQVIQGKLAAMLVDNVHYLPSIVQIEQEGKTWKLNVPWDAIMMITQIDEPVKVPAPDLSELAEFARENGIDVPEEVQNFVDNEA